MLPGCTSVPRGGTPVSGPTAEVHPLSVADPVVKETPAPVSDSEVSIAQAALRDASTWGAKYYEPVMYANAQAAFDTATAAREGDPLRCRSFLAQAAEAAGVAKEAALRAYEEDVRGRFEASRARLVEIRADRAFPDEFGRIVSGIDAALGLFAAKSYWDARIEAYGTLKGMGDLYERVQGLLGWLRDARLRVGSDISAARALDAQLWAPTELANAEKKYQDAMTQMQAGDLQTAVDSMRAAGVIAVRLPLLRSQVDTRGAGIPLTGRPAAPGNDNKIQGPRPELQPPPAGILLAGQRVHIAEMSMTSLGAPQKLYTAFAAAVARFDVVAAEGLKDKGIMEKVLSGMDESWEAAVSRSGYFGFIYSERIQMVKELGTYSGKGEFLHAPYGAQFRLVGTRFRVNLVLCHIEAGRDRKATAADIARLEDVHRYFEHLTGNRGITLLLAGGLGDLPVQSSESLAARGEMVPLRANLAAADGLGDRGQRVFASVPLRPLIEKSGFGASTPPVTYITIGAGT